jgi:hypothetical protein
MRFLFRGLSVNSNLGFENLLGGNHIDSLRLVDNYPSLVLFDGGLFGCYGISPSFVLYGLVINQRVARRV